MKGNKYVITQKSNNAISVVLQYDLKGLLIAMNIDGSVSDQTHTELVKGSIALKESAVPKIDREKFSVVKQPADLSFDRFWSDYDNKMKRVKAEELWNKLSDAERTKALLYITYYKNHCQINRTQPAYPTTYLNQRYWEN